MFPSPYAAAVALLLSGPLPAQPAVPADDIHGAYEQCVQNFQAAGDPGGVLSAMYTPGYPQINLTRGYGGHSVTTGSDTVSPNMVWDPVDASAFRGSNVAREPCSELYHELAHVADAQAHNNKRRQWCFVHRSSGWVNTNITIDEVEATRIENRYRAVRGLPKRPVYDGYRMPADTDRCLEYPARIEVAADAILFHVGVSMFIAGTLNRLTFVPDQICLPAPIAQTPAPAAPPPCPYRATETGSASLNGSLGGWSPPCTKTQAPPWENGQPATTLTLQAQATTLTWSWYATATFSKGNCDTERDTFTETLGAGSIAPGSPTSLPWTVFAATQTYHPVSEFSTLNNGPSTERFTFTYP